MSPCATFQAGPVKRAGSGPAPITVCVSPSAFPGARWHAQQTKGRSNRRAGKVFIWQASRATRPGPAMASSDRGIFQSGDRMDRFPNCRFYDRCLNTAAHQDVSLSCHGCRRYIPELLPQSEGFADFDPCIALWREVFSLPRARQEFLAPDPDTAESLS